MTAAESSTAQSAGELPAGWSIRPAALDDVPEILAVVHASDIVAVGVPDFTADEVVECLTAPNAESWVALDDRGAIRSWAYLDNHDRGDRELVDVYADPDGGQPGQGALLDLALARIAERATLFGHPTVTVGLGCVASETHYLGLIQAAGFRFLKRYARMTRALTAAEQPPSLPPGVSVRTLRRDDDDDLRAFYDLLRTAFDDIPDRVSGSFADYRARLATLSSISWDEWFVAECDGELAGILESSNQVVEENKAWIKKLAVDRRFRGRGIGRALLLTAFAAYAAKGRVEVGLGVDLTNPTRAYRLYESVGMSPAYETEAYEREITAA